MGAEGALDNQFSDMREEPVRLGDPPPSGRQTLGVCRDWPGKLDETQILPKNSERNSGKGIPTALNSGNGQFDSLNFR